MFIRCSFFTITWEVCTVCLWFLIIAVSPFVISFIVVLITSGTVQITFSLTKRTVRTHWFASMYTLMRSKALHVWMSAYAIQVGQTTARMKPWSNDSKNGTLVDGLTFLQLNFRSGPMRCYFCDCVCEIWWFNDN